MPKNFEYGRNNRFDSGQYQRFPSALNSESIGIDERSEQDLMAETVEISQLINFYDETNTPNGTWMPFLLKDSRWTYAWILSRDYTAKKTRFYYLLKAAQKRSEGELGDSIVGALETIIEIFLDVDLWSQNRRSVFNIPETRFDRFVESSIEGEFKSCFMRICDIISGIDIEGFDLSRKVDESIKRCMKIWDYRPVRSKPIETSKVMGLLAEVFGDSYGRYVSIIELARDEYQNTKYTGETSPDIAMLTAFIRLYERQRQQINTITKRHLDFQYRELLDFRERERTPDEAYVIFELAARLSRGLVPEGAVLNAGKDKAGKKVLFETLSETPVNKSRISNALTLYYDCGEGGSGLLYCGQHSGVGDLPKEGVPEPTPWPAFGSVERSDNPACCNEVVALSWTIASPALHLEGGGRSVKMTLHFDENSRGPLERLSSWGADNNRFLGLDYAISTKSGWLNIEPVESWNGEAVEISFEIDSSMPAIVVADWLAEESASLGKPILHWPALRMEIATDEALHVYPILSDAKLEKVEFEIDVDDLNIGGLYHDSNPVESTLPASAFSGIPSVGSSMVIGHREIFSKPLEKLSFTLDWDGLPSEGLKSYYSTYNDCFAYYKVPHYIEDSSYNVSFDLLYEKEWGPLKGGEAFRLFEEYGGKQQPPQSTFEFDFDTRNQYENTESAEEGSEGEPKQDPSLMGFVGDPSLLETPLAYNEGAQRGFLRINLESPQIAFGHSKLSQVVNYVTSINAKLAQEASQNIFDWIKGAGILGVGMWLLKEDNALKNWLNKVTALEKEHADWAIVIGLLAGGIAWLVNWFRKQKRKEGTKLPPNLPISPQIKGVKSRYRSRHLTHLSKSKGDDSPLQIMQETPFGSSELYAADTARPSLPFGECEPEEDEGVRILPCVKSEGALYLGIEDHQELDTLTVFWELIADDSQMTSLDKADLGVDYLSVDGWKPLRNNLLEDSTNGLMHTGLMRIVLPADLADDAQGMPHPACWLAFRSQRENGNFSKVRSIMLQAAKARRVIENDDLGENLVLPAGSISGFAKPNKDIAKLSQPYPSFGGKDKEDENSFYTRVSERLRHKNRAVTAWDFNRLILEKFETLCHVSVQTSSIDGPHSDCDVLAMVVPWYENAAQPNCFSPRSSPTFLHEVSEFISRRRSAFCRSKVVNPIFREVRCCFDVIFCDASGAGRKLDELNKGIRLFLSPWIRSETQQIELSATLRKSDILQFINSQPSVELVLNFRFEGEGDEVETLKLDGDASLFVSAEQHEINLVVENIL